MNLLRTFPAQECSKLEAAGYLKLLEDVAEVIPHSYGTESQLDRDLLIGLAFGN